MYLSLICPLSDIRLVGEGALLMAHIEVYQNGVWGTVCSDSWDYKFAEVACAQPGYGWYSQLRFITEKGQAQLC